MIVRETMLSVCDGIGGAAEALGPLGFGSVMLSEIESWPRALLAQRHGAVDVATWTPGGGIPLWGDFSAIRVRHLLRLGVPLPSVLIGGTPCQAFSVAGLRGSLGDARGNLTLAFVRLANAIDNARSVRGLPPLIVIWENVPGVLSTDDNAFGCFLGALVGDDAPLVPGRKQKWTNAGLVVGPRRKAAWIIKDAQYFRVAQRRRRVFLVASARAGFDPSEVLLEPDCMLRNPPSRGESRQVAAALAAASAGGVSVAGSIAFHDCTGTLSSRTTGGGGLGTDFDVAGGIVGAGHYLGNAEVGAADAPFLTASNLGKTVNNQTPLIGVEQEVYPITADALRGAGKAKTPSPDAEGKVRLRDPGLGVGADGDPAASLLAAGPGAVAICQPMDDVTVYAMQAGIVRQNPASGPDGMGVKENVAYTLEARAEVQMVAFTCKDHGQDASEDLSPTLRSMGHGGSHANGGGQVAVAYNLSPGSGSDGVPSAVETEVSAAITATSEADRNGRGTHVVAFALRGREEGAVPEVEGDGGVVSTLRSASGGSSRDYVAFAQNTRDEVRFINGDGAIAGALAAEAGMKQQTYVAEVGAEDVQAWSIMPMNSGKDYKARPVDVAQPLLAAGPTTGGQGGDMVTHYSISAVRRLTPMECERLQGYRDGYTDIDWRGRPDSPRYKALGNSWALPCVRWVGERIIKELDRVGEEAMTPGMVWGAEGPVEYRLAA